MKELERAQIERQTNMRAESRWPRLGAGSGLRRWSLLLVFARVIPATCSLFFFPVGANSGDALPVSSSQALKPAISNGEPNRTPEDLMRTAWDDLAKAVERHEKQSSESAASQTAYADLQSIRSAASTVSGASPVSMRGWESLLLVGIPQAQAWERYFWGRDGTRLQPAIERLSKYREPIDANLAKEGLPPEAVAVALVESEFVPIAVSPKGAVGVWQLMPATAKRYGLRSSAGHDERTDVQKSTTAAARYLADLSRLFGDWLLVLAAYNAGEDAVMNAMTKGKTSDFWSLSEQELLPEETRTYVPKVLGALRALRRAKQFTPPGVVGLGGTEPPDTQAWIYTTTSQR